MSKNYGTEYPERPLMAVLSDMLGIDHFTTSNGGTVRSDFLRAVLLKLGGDPADLRKDELIAACVTAASRQRFDVELLSPGGTVTNRALQEIVDGVTKHGIPGLLAARNVADLANSVAVDLSFDFDPHQVSDERGRRLAERAAREGQDAFRREVLRAYGNACSLTGSNAPTALEAAHITPYLGPSTNVLVNGICLRADLHRLWDGGQLAIDERHMVVVVGSALRASSYHTLHGRPVTNLPTRKSERPAPRALQAHREWCGL